MIAWTFLVTVAAAAPKPIETRTALIFPAAASGAVGEQRAVVRHLRFPRRVVHEMAVTGPGGADRRLVIPKSLAASIDADVERWARRLAKLPGGLSLGACAHPVAVERRSRRIELCLDAFDPKVRGQFVAWSNRLAATLE